METFILSSMLFQYLSRIFGSEKVVRTKRIFYCLDDCSKIEFPLRAVNSGSKAEGLDFPGSDLDIMFIYMMEEVFPDIRSCFHNSSRFYISTEDTPPGFAHINVQINPTGKPLDQIFVWRRWVDLVHTANGVKLQNCLFKDILCDDLWRFVYKSHGPCLSSTDDKNDLMFAFQLYCWPKVASGWISRPRLSDWPSSSLISNIVFETVLLVPIRSKFGSLKDNPNEWRISFSLAEKQLVHSFNHIQLMCYSMLKILLKEILNRNEVTKNLLCSYFMKTILFWTIEETGYSVWTPINLVKCFSSCIKKLSYLLRQEQLPNYFIPENNMIEGKFSKDSISDICSVLDLVNAEGIHFTLKTETLKDFLTTVRRNMYIGCQGDEVSILCSMVSSGTTLHARVQSPKLLTQNLYLLNIFKTKLIRTALYCRFVDETCAFAMSLDYDLNKGNKRLYCDYKNLLGYSLIGSKVCLLSWLVVGIIFYSNKNYINTLRITDFIRSEISLINRCSRDNLSSVRGRISFLHRLKLASCNFFGGLYLLTNMYSVIYHTDLLFKSPSKLQTIILSKLFSSFIRFMSFHHLKDFSKRRIALSDLLEMWEETKEEDIDLVFYFTITQVQRACMISQRRYPKSVDSRCFTRLLMLHDQLGNFQDIIDLRRHPVISAYSNEISKYLYS